MRLDILGTKVEVRIQERTVTFADIIYKGKVIATGVAIPNPLDVADGVVNPVDGGKIAFGRAIAQTPLGPATRAYLVAEVVGKLKLREARRWRKKIAAHFQDRLGLPQDIPSNSGRAKAFLAGLLGLPLKYR